VEPAAHFSTSFFLKVSVDQLSKNLYIPIRNQQGGGAEPGSRATYIVMAHVYFDSVEAFQTAFGPHAQAIMGDILNCTDTKPTIQISEVKIW
jgi:uncharacterized protein (TIGR02118 family)